MRPCRLVLYWMRANLDFSGARTRDQVGSLNDGDQDEVIFVLGDDSDSEDDRG